MSSTTSTRPALWPNFSMLTPALSMQRDHQVRERCALRHLDVAVALVRARAAADEQRRQVLVIVHVAVGHAAAVEEQRVIEQAAVAVGRGLAACRGTARTGRGDTCRS